MMLGLPPDAPPGSRDLYNIVAKSRDRGRGGDKAIKCMQCYGTHKLKSNLAVREELDRISMYLDPAAGVSCQNQLCSCFRYRVDLHPKLYHRHGKTPFGTPRWKCKGCGKTVSDVVYRRRPPCRCRDRSSDLSRPSVRRIVPGSSNDTIA